MLRCYQSRHSMPSPVFVIGISVVCIQGLALVGGAPTYWAVECIARRQRSTRPIVLMPSQIFCNRCPFLPTERRRISHHHHNVEDRGIWVAVRTCIGFPYVSLSRSICALNDRFYRFLNILLLSAPMFKWDGRVQGTATTDEALQRKPIQLIVIERNPCVDA